MFDCYLIRMSVVLGEGVLMSKLRLLDGTCVVWVLLGVSRGVRVSVMGGASTDCVGFEGVVI